MLKNNLKAIVFTLVVFAVVFGFFNWGEIKEVWSYFSVSPTQQAGVSIGACTVGVSFADFCTAPLRPTITWRITNGTQTAYALQVDNNGGGSCGSSFPSPEVDTGQVNSSSLSYTVPNGLLNYGTTYWWQVAARGGSSAWTGWIPHEVAFTTTLHQWPTIDFSWNPEDIRVGTEVQFIDQSTVYGGATKQSWSWVFGDDATPTTSTQQNPVIYYNNNGSYQVTLTVTDSDGYSCSLTKTVDVESSLINWQEIVPR